MDCASEADSDDYTMLLDPTTQKQMTVFLYQNVQNIEEVHKKIINKDFNCCIVKANLVVDVFQLVIAANRAVLNEKYNQMVTRNLFTEVIFCLSTSKNITQSLATFGISDSTKNILVVFIHKPEEKEQLAMVADSNIMGERIPLCRLKEFSDLSLIKKTYKINDEELKISSLLNSVISRLSDKIS